jgi:thiol-disulfide isomerase/thioredoxin
MEIAPKKFRAPEIYSEYWFNSDPFLLEDLRGSVVLVHFWDFTSLPSLRTLPYFDEWHRRYAENGLFTIGVHAPVFPFACDPAVVRRAVERLHIKYPVIMDNDFRVWGSYRNTMWPSRFLIDRDGFIRNVYSGEGFYQEFEHSIQAGLAESGYRGEFPLLMEPLRETDRSGAICYRATPQIFAGYQRGTIGNIEGSSPESTIQYEDPGYYLEGRLYLHGSWLTNRNFLKLEEQEGREGYVVISYRAKEVSIVAKPEGERQFQVFVYQDDIFLTGDNRGDDVSIDEEGRSFFLVQEPGLYSIVKNKEYGEHKLKLSCRSNGLALFSFSFVSALVPELISTN